jgi:AcrR family transcriptional regulator
MKKENKILASAWRIFLLYGYHGTTIEKIARDAEVSKTMVHYYFRSKDNLYQVLLEMITDGLLKDIDFKYPDAHLTWFIVTELRNNRNMFMKIIDDKLGAGSITRIQGLLKRSLEFHSFDDFLLEMNSPIKFMRMTFS